MTDLAQDLRRMMPGTGYREREVELLSGDGWGQTASGLYVPPSAAVKPRPTCIDLFAGCGGFSLGMHQAGFDVVGAIEWDCAAAATYLHNLGGPETAIHVQPERLPEWEKFHQLEAKRGGSWAPGAGWISKEPRPHPARAFWIWDTRELKGADILEALGMEVGEVDAIVGGPPCQGFSKMGRRDVMDPRNSLVFDFARLVCEIRPKTMVMENVEGLMSMVTPEGVSVVDALCRVLEDGGFGAYDAMKRSLTAMAGSGAALRNRSGPRGSAVESQEESPQEDLFS